MRVFDPGWRGPQAKAGTQDMDTEDWGNDPPGALDRSGPLPPLPARPWPVAHRRPACRLTTALAGSCDTGCLEALDWMATVHLRSRFCAADVLPDAQARLAATSAVLR